MFRRRIVLPAVVAASLLGLAPSASAEPVCMPWPLSPWCEDPAARAGELADAVVEWGTVTAETLRWKLNECHPRGTTPRRIEEFRACWLDY